MQRTLARQATTHNAKLASMRFLKPRRPKTKQPAPPRLDPEEQAIFEKLQASSRGAFSMPNEEALKEVSVPSAAAISEPEIKASNNGAELHPDVRRGAKDEFEGERNPKTGETGGPKKEPLRWGSEGDWSYNGRVTDF